MGNQPFLIYISILFSGLVWAYGAFRHHFNETDLFEEKIPILRTAVERERLRTRVEQGDMAVFRQQVASVIPEILKREGKGEMRKVLSLSTFFFNNSMRSKAIGVQNGRSRPTVTTADLKWTSF